jgi:hypothetical protein
MVLVLVLVGQMLGLSVPASPSRRSALSQRSLGGLLVSKGDVMADRQNYNSQSRRRGDVRSTPAPANRPQWYDAQKAKAKTVKSP